MSIMIKSATKKNISRRVLTLVNDLAYLDKELNEQFFRGSKPSIGSVYRDVFNFDDLITVLQRCVTSKEDSYIDSLIQQQECFKRKLKRIEYARFSTIEVNEALKDYLEILIQDYSDYVTSLPKNVSKDGDGFANILSIRQSIHATISTLLTRGEKDSWSDRIRHIDEGLIANSDEDWFWKHVSEDCEDQLLNKHPLERWWWYNSSILDT